VASLSTIPVKPFQGVVGEPAITWSWGTFYPNFNLDRIRLGLSRSCKYQVGAVGAERPPSNSICPQGWPAPGRVASLGRAQGLYPRAAFAQEAQRGMPAILKYFSMGSDGQ